MLRTYQALFGEPARRDALTRLHGLLDERQG
jgi:hypothetical protein